MSAGERYRESVAYWELIMEVSDANHSAKQLLIACENLYQLEPDDLRHKLNYAAALLSRRTQLNKALALTFEVIEDHPENLLVRINHGKALLLNGRLGEAARILKTVNEKKLSSTQRQSFYFVWAELLYRDGQADEALRAAQEVISELLLPGDRLVLQSILEALASGA